MSSPWFRRWMRFGYVPITWQGWAVLAVKLLIFAPAAAAFLILDDQHAVASWLCAGLAAISASVGHAIVLWKLDRGYGN